MSEKPTDQNPKPAEEKQKGQDIHLDVKVDNSETKRIAEELAAEKIAKKELEEKLAKMDAESKTRAEESKKISEEAEDLKNKLGILAEKELDKKRKGVTEKANALLKDPERVKEITDRLSTPDGVEQMEYTMNVLEKQMRKGEEEFKAFQSEQQKKLEQAAKDKEAAESAIKAANELAAKSGKPITELPKLETPTGSAPLNAQQMGGANAADMSHLKFDSYGAMIRYLQEVEKGDDKLKAAEAKTALNDLLKKWATLVKQNYVEHKDMPMETFEGPQGKQGVQPLFKEMGLSKRAKEELERRRRGEAPQAVA